MNEPQDSGDSTELEEPGTGILTRLQMLWSSEIPVASLDEAMDMVLEGVKFAPHTTGLWSDHLRSLMIDRRPSRKIPGHPDGHRLLQATMKLLLCAPRGLLLTQEKEWLTSQYLDEVKGKQAQNEIKKTKRRAARNAAMCIARAEASVIEFYLQHPEIKQTHLSMREMVKNGLAEQASNPHPGT